MAGAGADTAVADAFSLAVSSDKVVIGETVGGLQGSTSGAIAGEPVLLWSLSNISIACEAAIGTVSGLMADALSVFTTSSPGDDTGDADGESDIVLQEVEGEIGSRSMNYVYLNAEMWEWCRPRLVEGLLWLSRAGRNLRSEPAREKDILLASLVRFTRWMTGCMYGSQD